MPRTSKAPFQGCRTSFTCARMLLLFVCVGLGCGGRSTKDGTASTHAAKTAARPMHTVAAGDGSAISTLRLSPTQERRNGI